MAGHEANPKSEDTRGLIVYLFLMGELVDAYQSRTLPHVERVTLGAGVGLPSQ